MYRIRHEINNNIGLVIILSVHLEFSLYDFPDLLSSGRSRNLLNVSLRLFATHHFRVFNVSF